MAHKSNVVKLPPPEPLLCATAGCQRDAKIRVKRHRAEWKQGKSNPVHVAFGPWLNFCYPCADKVHREESREYCELMGLDTVEKQKAWCLKQIKRGKNMLLPETVLREPGEDLDEFHPATQA